MFVGTDYRYAAAPDQTLLGEEQALVGNQFNDGSQWSSHGASGVGASLASRLSSQVAVDPGFKRPYLDRDGRLAVTVNSGRFSKQDGRGGEPVPILEHHLVRDLVDNGVMLPPPVTNATALRKEEWIELDKTVVRAARKRLRLYSDINRLSAGVSLNGMSKSIFEYETMADPGSAIVGMTGLEPGPNDETAFQLEGLPLPITHCDFWVDSRRLGMSRNTGTPFDSTMGEASARRVGEMVEKTAIGNVTGITFGGNSTQTGGYGRTSSVYGLTNFGARQTRTGTAPTSANWTPETTLNDVLNSIQQLRNSGFYGPFMIYHSTDWDPYLDKPYQMLGGAASTVGLATNTLRQQICAIGEGDGTGDGEKVIAGCRRLDFLFAVAPPATQGNAGMNYFDTLYPFTMCVVQMTPEVIRAVNGLDVTTVQWEEMGGMKIKFKVMAIQMAQLRADYYSNCGLLHLTCS